VKRKDSAFPLSLQYVTACQAGGWVLGAPIYIPCIAIWQDIDAGLWTAALADVAASSEEASEHYEIAQRALADASALRDELAKAREGMSV